MSRNFISSGSEIHAFVQLAVKKTDFIDNVYQDILNIRGSTEKNVNQFD